jgi:hypothetical protein
MQSLSKAAEQKLIGAIEQAAAMVNGGMEPNAAIIKSATDADIPSGHINLMVHAYNTGRTTKQRENGDTVYEKAADFKLADTNTVLAALFPAQVKTAAELVRDTTVSTEYAVSPAGFLARHRSAVQKSAAASVSLPAPTYTPTPRDPEGAVRRAYSLKVAAQRDAEELRRQATTAYTKAANALDELGTYFRTPGNMPFHDAVHQVGLRLGPTGVSVLQKVAAAYPRLEKQAATGRDYFGHDKLYDLVNTALDAVTTYVDAADKAPQSKEAAAKKKDEPAVVTGSILSAIEPQPFQLKDAASLNPSVQVPYRPGMAPGVSRPPAGSLRPLKDYSSSAGTPAELQREVALRFRSPSAASGGAANNARSSIADWLENDVAREQANSAQAAAAEAAAADASILDAFRQTNQRVRDDEDWRQNSRREDTTSVLPTAPSPASQPVDTGSGSTGRDGKDGKPEKERKNEKERKPAANTGAQRPAPAKPESGGFWANYKAPITAAGESVGIGGAVTPTSLSKNLLGLDADPAAMKQTAYESLSAPDHETNLKNIRAQATLHDMMMNDPVVSGYDPHEVALAFNDVASVAPTIVESPAVLQAVLRKRLESGQLADFDVKQLMEMDKLRADRDQSMLKSREIEKGLV